MVLFVNVVIHLLVVIIIGSNLRNQFFQCSAYGRFQVPVTYPSVMLCNQLLSEAASEHRIQSEARPWSEKKLKL